MSSQSIRILGIDPGLQVTGFGVIDVQGTQLGYVASGTVRTEAGRSLPERLKVLFDGVCAVGERYQPQVAVVEIVFVNTDPQATLNLGQARGACVTALVHKELAVHEYTALQLKKGASGDRTGRNVQIYLLELWYAQGWTSCSTAPCCTPSSNRQPARRWAAAGAPARTPRT